MKKVYLSGAIFGVADPDTWREMVIKQLPKNWKYVNPRDIEVDGLSANEIVAVDLAAIRKCDALFVRAFEPSWGTAMEVMYAKMINIPVLTWVSNVDGQQPPWLEAHSYVMDDNIQSLVLTLEHIE